MTAYATLSDWTEWRERCAIALCPDDVAKRLRDFAYPRFRRYLSFAIGEEATRDEMPGHDACWDLLEHDLATARPRSGRRYKEWLFARLENSKGDPLDVIQGGATLLLRSVVRTWAKNIPDIQGHLSLNREIPGCEGITYLDLLPDERAGDVPEEGEQIADAAQIADIVFRGLCRAERLVLLAGSAGVPLYHPHILTVIGFGKTKVAALRKDVLLKIAEEIQRTWPEESTDWKTAVALKAHDALNELVEATDEGGAQRTWLARLAAGR